MHEGASVDGDGPAILGDLVVQPALPVVQQAVGGGTSVGVKQLVVEVHPLGAAIQVVRMDAHPRPPLRLKPAQEPILIDVLRDFFYVSESFICV